MLIGKRKDKKDKDRGYEALEGESSDEARYLVMSIPLKFLSLLLLTQLFGKLINAF